MKIIIDYLEEHARNNPTKIAIIFNNEEITYGELYSRASKFSNFLNTLQKNSVVSLLFDNSINFVISYLGTLKAGHVAHILSPDISQKNLILQLQSANPILLIIDDVFFEKFSKSELSMDLEKFSNCFLENKIIDKQIAHNNISHLLYTSGTTSEPKGVPITHSNVMFTLNNIVSILQYDNSDIVLLPLPLHHSFGLGTLNTSLYVGSQLILLPNASDLDLMLKLIKHHNVTTFSAVPATLIKLLKFHQSEIETLFKNLRLILTNSTFILPETVYEYKKILQYGNLSTYYGLTEASRSTFMIFKKELNKDSSVGKPAPSVELQIRNKDKGIGEIWIKGKNVIDSYWMNPKENKNLIDGWIKTGDLGYFDEDGFLYLSGRVDDVINVGGEKVFPHYVENVINQINGIEQVIVVGDKHPVFGETVKALVKLNVNSKLTKFDIVTFCIKNLEKFMIPTKIEFIDQIPQTEYGKIKRFMFKSKDDAK